MPLAGQIPSSRDVPASVNRGVPIVQDDPKHPVSQAIAQFAQDEVINLGLSPEQITTRRRTVRKRRLWR
jgi:pilus assembly protein CpaE